MSYTHKLQEGFDQGKTVCIGLDPSLAKIPKCIDSKADSGRIIRFCKEIIDATSDIALAYKPNMAFFDALGPDGLRALEHVVKHIQRTAQEVVVILDGKRGDIGNTNLGYIEQLFLSLDADAVTVPPWMGAESLEPFWSRPDKGTIVLCRTSNPGAAFLQDRLSKVTDAEGERWGLPRSRQGYYASIPNYELVAHMVQEECNPHDNCGLVVGATAPEQLANVRAIVGEMPILIPGIGAQGGNLEATVKAGANSKGQGMIINNSRGILYASSEVYFAEAAREAALEMHTGIDTVLATA